MPADTAPVGTGNVGAHRPGVVREHARIGDLRAVRIFDRNPGCRSTMSQASDSMQKARRLPTFLIFFPYHSSTPARVSPCPAARHGPAAGPVRLPGAASIRRPAGGDQASPVRSGGTCPAGGYGWGAVYPNDPPWRRRLTRVPMWAMLPEPCVAISVAIPAREPPKLTDHERN